MKVLNNDVFPELQAQREIVEYCKRGLREGEIKRKSIGSQEEWTVLQNNYHKIIRNAFPEILFDRNRSLNIKVISKYEFEDYRIENVIFESLPGWEVKWRI
jgi:hypothetical protein